MKNLIIKFLGAYFRSGLRGSSRLTEFLSQRFEFLEAVPFETNGGTVFGDMRMPVYRGLLVYSGQETDEEIVMRKFVSAGDTAFDIGVFWGLYTAYLSKMVGPAGQVHSFEPNSSLHRCLEMTAKKLGNVTLHGVALSDRTGEVDFFIPWEDASMASLTNWTDDLGWKVNKITCQMQPLDDLIASGKAPQPDFIKCDVEGAELSVFTGARATLDRVDAPIIMFEVNPKSMQAFEVEADATFKFLQGLENAEYQFFEVIDGRIEPVADFSGLHFNKWGFTNAIAVPASKCGNLDI